MSLVERCVHTIWTASPARDLHDGAAPLCAEELLQLLFRHSRYAAGTAEWARIENRLPKMTGRYICAHEYEEKLWLFWPCSDAVRTELQSTSTKRPHSVLENDLPTHTKAQTPSARARTFPSPLRVFGAPQTVEPPQITVSSRGRGVHRAFRSPMKGTTLTSANKGNRTHATAHPPDDTETVRTLRSGQRQLESRIRQLEDQNRKTALIKGYQSKDEARQVDTLTVKWRRVAREALVAFRALLGPIQMNEARQDYGGWGFNEFSVPTEMGDKSESVIPEEVRVPTLKELCQKLRLEINVFGEYDSDHDDFIDQ
ncbi:hypothetical protein HDU89_001127 [Geranomyces variabilis]|nr:hypothetical protein HDU89_001127 [Geranomyces variabilis]